MAIRYVASSTGVNAGAGGLGAPWLTLSYATANAVTGDTIIAWSEFDGSGKPIPFLNETIAPTGGKRLDWIFRFAVMHNSAATVTAITLAGANTSVATTVRGSLTITKYSSSGGNVLTMSTGLGDFRLPSGGHFIHFLILQHRFSSEGGSGNCSY